MTPERYRKITQVLDQRQPDLTVITEKVYKGHNISAIMRTCDAVGIPRLHAIWPEGRMRIARGTSMGSQRWVRVRRHPDVDHAIDELSDQGLQVYAAHLSDTAVDFRDIDYTRPTAVLLGTEREGVSDHAAARVDGHIQVPMHGMVESFNVSVAAAIILMEAERQRRDAGFYDRPRLDAESYRRLFFEWAHPKLAHFCRERGLDYPEVDDTGEVRDGPGWYRRVREGQARTTEDLPE